MSDDTPLELEISLAICLLLSAVYLVYDFIAEPAGGHPFGHWLGIVGTLLMLVTETLYSVRKRVRWFKDLGPLRWWLSFHIVTGLVGPFLVLMHTGLAFRGLAGVTMALTVLVVSSGFIGRYLYTAIPHSLVGAEASAAELTNQVKQVQAGLVTLAQQRSAAVQALVEADTHRPRQQRSAVWLVLLRSWDEWRYRTRLRQQVRQLEKTEQRQLADVEKMLVQRRNLERQVRMLEGARRLLSFWHLAHVPMGLTLFGSIAIHIAATFYFSAGLFGAP